MRKLLLFLATVGIMVGVLVVANKPPQLVNPPPQKKQQAEVKPFPQPKKLSLEEVLASFREPQAIQRLASNVAFLCNPDLAGRMSGQKGNRMAAEWAVENFKQRGLAPGFGTSYYQTFKIQNLNTAKEQGNGETSNVVGILKGGPRCIVIGAHIDHIGYGPSMSRTPNRREIHPGADDNASSVAALMEIVRAFTSLKDQNKHTIIFIAFSAEEMGLLGADYYVSNPAIPLSQVDFMLNMDMIGRFKSSVDFFGANSLSTFRDAAKKVSSKINFSKSVGGGSDHAPFGRKGIPVIFVHTGLHGEYHTPDDTPDRLNFEGIRDISQWVFHYCWLLDSQEQFPRVNLFIPSGKWSDHDSEVGR